MLPVGQSRCPRGHNSYHHCWWQFGCRRGNDNRTGNRCDRVIHDWHAHYPHVSSDCILNRYYRDHRRRQNNPRGHTRMSSPMRIAGGLHEPTQIFITWKKEETHFFFYLKKNKIQNLQLLVKNNHVPKKTFLGIGKQTLIRKSVFLYKNILTISKQNLQFSSNFNLCLNSATLLKIHCFSDFLKKSLRLLNFIVLIATSYSEIQKSLAFQRAKFFLEIHCFAFFF